jgi:hypothetical protein
LTNNRLDAETKVAGSCPQEQDLFSVLTFLCRRWCICRLLLTVLLSLVTGYVFLVVFGSLNQQLLDWSAAGAFFITQTVWFICQDSWSDNRACPHQESGCPENVTHKQAAGTHKMLPRLSHFV